jgi:uncharacterized membrane protein YoaK (UPF0700 family)
MKLLSPTARTERRLTVCLALIAGYVDAYGLRAFSTYVSFMSGNTTQTGIMIGHGHLVAALPSRSRSCSSWQGPRLGPGSPNSGLRQSRRLLFGVVAALLAATLGVMQPGLLDAKVCIVMLSLAMGMMNTALSRVGSEAVSLTFVTGSLNRMGATWPSSSGRPCRTCRDRGTPISAGPASWPAYGPAS